MADPLEEIGDEERAALWRYRHFILSSAEALPKFLQSFSWADPNQVAEMHTLLFRWAPLKPVAALELLDAKFADAQIRSYAVGCLEDMSDAELAAYTLQLVQVCDRTLLRPRPLPHPLSRAQPPPSCTRALSHARW